MGRLSTGLTLLLAALAGCGDDGTPSGADAATPPPPPADAAPPRDAGSPGDAGRDAGPAAPVSVRLLAINDFHGRLLPPPGELGGASYLAAHVRRAEAEEPNTLLVSAGDLIGASTFLSGLFHDEPTLDVMDAMGLDVACVGNHEFDRPLAELRRLLHGGCHPDDDCSAGDAHDGVGFPMLGANVIDVASGEPAFPTWELRELDGARVAFVGLTTRTTGSIVYAPFVEGLRFADEAETVNALVPEIRAAGAEVIVLLLHEGGHTAGGGPSSCLGLSGPIVEIAERLDPAVDVVLSGHSHAAYVCPMDGGPLLTSAGDFGRLLTRVELQIDPATQTLLEVTAENLPVTRDVEPDAVVQAMLDGLESRADVARQRVIGSVTETISNAVDGDGGSPLGHRVADAFLAASPDDVAVAFTNQGGIRASLVYERGPGETADGQVTYGEAYEVLPFGNWLVTMTLRGAQLERLLEQQIGDDGSTAFLFPSEGFTFTWDPAGRPGDHVDPASVRVAGEPLDLGASYRVTTNNFVAEGGGGFSVFLEGTERVSGPSDLEALEGYLAARSPVTPPSGPRARRR